MATWPVGETIGPKRSFTKEGFLLCKDVPIARTGPMVYRAGELPSIEPGSTGVVIVQRAPEDVFDEMAIASFEGKPIVVDHPVQNGKQVLLTSDNWRQFACGSIHNVRRGEGIQDQLLIADLLVTDSMAISEIMAGRREVSCGYVAEYAQIASGQARQHSVRGNHVALVKQGRCGSTCMIGDNMPNMTMEQRLAAARAERDARIKAADDAFQTSVTSMVTGDNIAMPGPGAQTATDPGGRIVVNVHGGAKAGMADAPVPGAAPAVPGVMAAPPPAAGAAPAGGDVMMQVLAKLDQLMALLTEGGDGDEDDQFQTSSQSSEGVKPDIGANGEGKVKEKMESGDEGDLTKAVATKKVGEPMGKTGTGGSMPTGDSKPKKGTATADSSAHAATFQNAVSRGEILAAGIELPSFDAKQPETTTLDCLCKFRRAALQQALNDPKTKPLIGGFIGTTDIATADGAQVETLFMGASELVAMARKTQAPTHMAPGNTMRFATRDSKGPMTPQEINEKSAKLWGRTAA